MSTVALFGKRPFSDPGGEDVNAPVGSEGWAKRWRLELQGIVKNLSYQPERAELYLKQGQELRVWTLLNKRDGSRFAGFEEFCEHPEPWGLGRPFKDIVPYLEALHGKRGAQLQVVAPDGRVDNRRGGKGAVDSGHDVPNQQAAEDKNAKRLRAILRAPQPIQQLYRDGLIGQAVAAKLGPDHPTPEQAATIAEIVEAVCDTPRPEAKAKAPGVQREVNARVRSMLNEPADDPVAKVLRLVARMSDQQRERLALAIAPELGLRST